MRGHPRSSRSHQISIFSILPYLFSLLFKIDMWGVLFDGSICIVLIRVDSIQSTMPNFKMKYKNVVFMIKMETMCQGVLCNDFMSCYFFIHCFYMTVPPWPIYYSQLHLLVFCRCSFIWISQFALLS